MVEEKVEKRLRDHVKGQKPVREKRKRKKRKEEERKGREGKYDEVRG